MINWPINLPTLTSQQKTHQAITLRPLQERDIESVFLACQDPTISAFTRVPFPYEKAMAEDFVREADVAYRNHVSASFAIESQGKFAGTIGLHSLQLGDHMAEVGYWMSKEFRGKGICTEAMSILANFSLEIMGFRRLEALADFDNIASQKVMEKSGFLREALLKNRTTKRDGRQVDMVLYAKTRS